MNKLSKIFLAIIIVLVIVVIAMYIRMVKISKQNLENTLSSSEEIFKITSAVENAGFELEVQEDGSYLLVEKQN